MAVAQGPDFLCVGAEKAGTGWLYDQLCAHPGVWMPPIKEIHFFDSPRGALRHLRQKAQAIQSGDAAPSSRLVVADSADRNHLASRDQAFLTHALTAAKRPSNMEWYADLFAAKGPLVSGDITPGYARLDGEKIRQITARFPGIRVIYLARDPVDRFWSFANMWVRRERRAGKPPPDLSDWEHLRRLLDSPSVVARSHPSETARRWKAHVAGAQFFLGFFDDLVRDPVALRTRIFEFLQLDRQHDNLLPPDFNRKTSRRKAPMSDAIRSRLIEHFHQEYLDAARELGGPAENWLERQLQRIGKEPSPAA